jgi:hypothetical protein
MASSILPICLLAMPRLLKAEAQSGFDLSTCGYGMAQCILLRADGM